MFRLLCKLPSKMTHARSSRIVPIPVRVRSAMSLTHKPPPHLIPVLLHPPPRPIAVNLDPFEVLLSLTTTPETVNRSMNHPYTQATFIKPLFIQPADLKTLVKLWRLDWTRQ